MAKSSVRVAFRATASLSCLLLCSLAQAATFTVTRADDPPADGCQPTDCSLREAFEAAAASPPADTVVLAAGQYTLTQTGVTAVGDVTLVGAGRDETLVTRLSGAALFRTSHFSTLTLQALEARADDSAPIVLAAGPSTVVYRDVRLPYPYGRAFELDADPEAEVHVLVDGSSLDNGLACVLPVGGSCTLIDSSVAAVAAGEAGLTLERTVVDGAALDGAGPGIIAVGSGPIAIRDSIVRNTLAPLLLSQTVQANAPPVDIQRTRFLDNGGPLRGNRRSAMRLTDVEIRGHVVAQDGSAAAARPAAIEAQPGPFWLLSRMLIADNRGGSGADGAAVRLLGGSQMLVFNATFDNNDFHPDAAEGVGGSIGVFANTATTLGLVHVSMRRATGAGSEPTVLSVRGAQAAVTLANSLLAGSCSLLQGGTVQAASAGNLQTLSNGCDLDDQTNQVNVIAALGLGALADHGGFTHTFAEPAINNPMSGSAAVPGCQLAQLDQRGFVRPADGVGCDVGAVEAGALPPTTDVFADGFESP